MERDQYGDRYAGGKIILKWIWARCVVMFWKDIQDRDEWRAYVKAVMFFKIQLVI